MAHPLYAQPISSDQSLGRSSSASSSTPSSPEMDSQPPTAGADALSRSDGILLDPTAYPGAAGLSSSLPVASSILSLSVGAVKAELPSALAASAGAGRSPHYPLQHPHLYSYPPPQLPPPQQQQHLAQQQQHLAQQLQHPQHPQQQQQPLQHGVAFRVPKLRLDAKVRLAEDDYRRSSSEQSPRTPSPRCELLSPRIMLESPRDGDSPRTAAAKRYRKSLVQLGVLEEYFTMNPKPNKDTREKLSVQLKLSPRQVQVWFQNRRAKVRGRDAAAAVRQLDEIDDEEDDADSDSDGYLPDQGVAAPATAESPVAATVCATYPVHYEDGPAVALGGEGARYHPSNFAQDITAARNDVGSVSDWAVSPHMLYGTPSSFVQYDLASTSYVLSPEMMLATHEDSFGGGGGGGVGADSLHVLDYNSSLMMMEDHDSMDRDHY